MDGRSDSTFESAIRHCLRVIRPDKVGLINYEVAVVMEAFSDVASAPDAADSYCTDYSKTTWGRVVHETVGGRRSLLPVCLPA